MEQSCFFFGAVGGYKEFSFEIYYALSKKKKKYENKFSLVVVEEKETFAVQFMLLNQFLLLL